MSSTSRPVVSVATALREASTVLVLYHLSYALCVCVPCMPCAPFSVLSVLCVPRLAAATAPAQLAGYA